MTTAHLSLHPLPPLSPRVILKAPLPAHNSTSGARRRIITPPCMVCSNRGQSQSQSQSPDDYHATLKALNSKGRTPRKSLGQHYMLNNEINEQLARAANVEEGDVVLEIGPGTGSLTNVLINSGAIVLAIEKEETAVRLVESSLQTSEYRPINIFVNFYSDPEYKLKVPRTYFFPQPNLKQAAEYLKFLP